MTILARTTEKTIRCGRYYKHRYIFLLLAPGLIYFLLFRIAPMWGLLLAFKDFTPYTKFWESPWVGFKYFNEFFTTPRFFFMLRNTLAISFLNIFFLFPPAYPSGAFNQRMPFPQVQKNRADDRLSSALSFLGRHYGAVIRAFVGGYRCGQQAYPGRRRHTGQVFVDAQLFLVGHFATECLARDGMGLDSVPGGHQSNRSEFVRSR